MEIKEWWLIMMMIKTIILRVLKILVGLILYKKHRGTVEWV